MRKAMPMHVLHLEDLRLARDALRRVLARAPYVLHDAGTLAEARELLRARDDWCGIIADYHLPDGTGFELVREVLARFPGLPVVIVTGDDSSEVTNEVTSTSTRFLRKPFGIAHLEPFLASVARFEGSPRGPRVTALAREQRLSPRELDVFRPSLDETPILEIGLALGIRESTVRAHRANVLRNVGAPDLETLRRRLFG